MVLAQKQTGRPMEQTRGPRHRSMMLQLIFDKVTQNLVEKTQFFNKCGETGYLHVED
jgi:hypothetical protein